MALPVRVGFADALHLATAAVARAAAVLTNDEDWKAIVDAAGRMEPRRTSTYRTMRILVVDELAFDL
jgi:predicted nucleic acid-binding protein